MKQPSNSQAPVDCEGDIGRRAEAERTSDNLTYRVTVTEQTTVSICTAIKELQAEFNRQSSDIQVMK